MDEIPDDELEGTRAALAPTLDATAAILPWVAKPKALRFDAELNERWITTCQTLAKCWAARHDEASTSPRQAIFALYSIALETGDIDCLHLGEALASAADGLEAPQPTHRLLAALSATIECFNDPAGLEHVLFAERARHFAQRLEDSLTQASTGNLRSAVLDRLFLGESDERLERVRDALAALPPDAYAIKIEIEELIQQAEHLELYGIVHLARQLLHGIPDDARLDELDSPAVRETMHAQLQLIEQALAGLSA